MGAIIVLGGHRTGTSLTAGLVHRLGFPAAPDPKRLIPPHPVDNPEGYWEDAAFVRIHRRMLSEHTRRRGWADPRRDAAAIAALARRYQQLVRQRAAAHRHWSLKDPRLCLLGDVLGRALEEESIEFRVVTTCRPIEAAAASLARRGLPIDASRRLALRYESERLRLLGDLVRCGVGLHEIAFDRLTDPDSAEAVLRELAQFLGVKGNSGLATVIRPRNRSADDAPPHEPLRWPAA